MNSETTRFTRLNAFCLLLGLLLWVCIGIKLFLSIVPFSFQKIPVFISACAGVEVSGLIAIFTLVREHLKGLPEGSTMGRVLGGMELALHVLMVAIPGWVLCVYNGVWEKNCMVQSQTLQVVEAKLSDTSLVLIQSGAPGMDGAAGVRAYRSGLVHRLLNGEGVDSACQPAYVHQIDSLGTDALWVLLRRLDTPDSIAAELNRAILRSDMQAVEAVYRRFNIPSDAMALHYVSGQLAVLGNLKNYIRASLVGVEPPISLHAAWPPDFLRANYRNEAIVYIVD